MNEIKVTQADRDCEEKIIKAMVSSSFLPGCFAAAHRQAAMIEGARLMRDYIALFVAAPDRFPFVQGAAILALDPASVVGEGE